MNLNTLKPSEGAVRTNYRRGRGQGSGGGGTATRGHKGNQSRAGYKRKRGFEGGQMPLQRRLPKFGFKNINRIDYAAFNLDTLQELVTQHKINLFTPDSLRELGLASKNDNIKILGRGKLTSKIEVSAHAFSKTAIAAIEALGGTYTTLDL